MLQAMRQGSKSPIMKIFLLFLAAGFALWGVGDITSGLFGRGDKAVKAGNSSVSAIEAATEFELVRRSNFSTIPVGQAIQLGLLAEVMGGLARRTLVEEEARQMGLATTREMERDVIAKEPSFQDEQGQFSEGRFLAALGGSGLSEQEWLKRLDFSMLNDQLVASVAGGARFSGQLASMLAAYDLEKRQASILAFPVDTASIAAPEEKTLIDYYAENGASYDAPVLRDFSVIWLTARQMMADITLSEDDIKLAFDTRMDEFSTPEMRRVRQMVFDSEAEALAARDRLEAGSDFNQLAGELLNWTEDDVQLGNVARADLDGALAETVFASEIGQLAGPAETVFGWHLVIVDEITQGKSPSLAEVRADIEEALRAEQAYGVLVAKVNALEDELGAGASLAEAANATGLVLEKITGLDRNGLDIDGQPVSGPLAELASDTGFLELAWSLDIDETSVIGESGEDSFFVVRALAEADARSRPLDEVRNRVIADWQRGQAVDAARAAAKGAIDQPGPAFENQPATGLFQRNGAGLDHPAAALIASRAFSLAKTQAGLVETGEAAYAVRLLDIRPAETGEVSELAEQVLINLSAPVADDIAAALAVDWSERHKLELNPELVQQILIGQQQ